MKLKLFFFLIILIPAGVYAQTETTQGLIKRFEGNGLFTLYFYKNTLKMLNQNDDPAFDEMVKNIEKLRFMLIDKTEGKFAPAEYKQLLKSYKAESYEEIMTTRMDGRNFDVYLKDKKGSSLGTIILVNDSSKLYIMDMIGSVDLSKATQVFSSIEKNGDLSGKIKSFMNKDAKKEDNKHHE